MRLNNCTALAEGMLADMIVIDLNQPNMRPKNDIIKKSVYAGWSQNVLITMINGRILYENGNYYIGRTVEEIYEKAKKIIARIKKNRKIIRIFAEATLAGIWYLKKKSVVSRLKTKKNYRLKTTD